VWVLWAIAAAAVVLVVVVVDSSPRAGAVGCGLLPAR